MDPSLCPNSRPKFDETVHPLEMATPEGDRTRSGELGELGGELRGGVRLRHHERKHSQPFEQYEVSIPVLRT